MAIHSKVNKPKNYQIVSPFEIQHFVLDIPIMKEKYQYNAVKFSLKSSLKARALCAYAGVISGLLTVGVSTLVISLTSCISTYFIATAAFFLLLNFNVDIPGLWRIFIVPLPIISILCIVFSSIWVRGKLPLCLSVSALIWSVMLLAFVMLIGITNAWFLFVIAVPLQIIVLFWMSLLYKGKVNLKWKRGKEKGAKAKSTKENLRAKAE